MKEFNVSAYLKLVFAGAVAVTALNYASDKAGLNWPQIIPEAGEPAVHSCQGIIPELKQACEDGRLNIQAPR